MSFREIPLGELEGGKGNFVDGPFGSNLKASEYTSEGVPLIQLKNIKPNVYLPKNIKYVSSEKAKTIDRHTYKAGDVVIAKLGAVGTSCIIPKGEPDGIVVADVMRFRGDQSLIDYKYLSYFLNSAEGKRRALKLSRGTTRIRTNLTDFKKIKIPLPPLEEQKRIAAILDKADAIRRKRQAAIELADQFLRSVFLDMFGDPVTNPKGWEMVIIGDLVSEVKYGTSAKADEFEGNYPILRMGNITYSGEWDFSSLKYINISDRDREKYLVQDGDLVFNRTNSKDLVGKTAVFNSIESMAIAGYLIRVRPNQNGNNYYISGYLNSSHGKLTLKSMCKSIVGMANINAQELQKIKILLPPLELQNKFEMIYKETKHRVFKQNQSVDKISDLFNSLSQKAFNGELSNG